MRDKGHQRRGWSKQHEEYLKEYSIYHLAYFYDGPYKNRKSFYKANSPLDPSWLGAMLDAWLAKGWLVQNGNFIALTPAGREVLER